MDYALYEGVSKRGVVATYVSLMSPQLTLFVSSGSSLPMRLSKSYQGRSKTALLEGVIVHQRAELLF